MANTCFSWIKIYGDESTIRTIKHIIEKAEPNEDLFITFIGIPDYMTEDEFKNGGKYLDWIGTTTGWFYNKNETDFYENEITISMESRWSPPDDFIKTFSKMYNVNCIIDYEESSNFCGRTTCTWDGDAHDVIVEDYDYLEGVYRLRDNFWDEVEHYTDMILDEELTLKDFLIYFPFVTDEDKIELTRLYNETIENNDNDDDTEGK